jgi:hypothetical protein
VTRYLVNKLTRKDLPAQLPQNCTLLDVFIFDDSFNHGEFQDRYFSGFKQYISPREAQAFFYNPTLLCSLLKTRSIFRAMSRSRERFLPKEYFLKPSDYIFAFLYPFRALKLIPPRTHWEGLDITGLLRAIWYEHLSSMSTTEGLLKYRFARRLRQAGVSLRLVIDWFENQIIDKGANAGFRQFFPEVPIIGYNTVCSKHYQCMVHPTSAEYQAGVLPQVVAVCGKGFAASRQAFCKEIEVITAPAFRNAWVWRQATACPDPYHITILLVLSVVVEESLTSLKACIAAAECGLPPRVRFWVKPHPGGIAMEKLLLQAGISLPPGFTVVEGDFTRWAEKADIIVGNESGTVLEALAKGIPAIVIGNRSRLTLHAIPDAVPQEIWQLCFTPGEVAGAIKSLSNSRNGKRQSHQKLAESIREQYFEPVTETGVRAFLRLNGSLNQ